MKKLSFVKLNHTNLNRQLIIYRPKCVSIDKNTTFFYNSASEI